MKKIAMNVIGLVLFIAGYQQARRQAEYITSQATLTNATYTTKAVSLPANMKRTFALRLTKPV